jgi:HK97 family phage major capsid protein
MSDLTRDLYAYLMNHLYSVSHERRCHGYWVMSQEWWAEIRRMADPDGRSVVMPRFDDPALFGLPVWIMDEPGLPRLAGPGIPPPGNWRPVRRYT